VQIVDLSLDDTFMRFIFSTGSLHTYGTNRCFELASQAGFDGIELMADRPWDTRQPEYLLRLVERHRLPIVVVHVPLRSFAVPGWPDDEPGRVVETVKLAEALAAEVVNLHLPERSFVRWVKVGSTRIPVPFPGDDGYRRWLLNDYPALQAATRMTLCIENMPAIRWLGRRWNPCHWNTPAELVRFPALTMDTTHLGTWALDPLEVYGQLGGRVRHIHLSNFDGKEHRRPETGQLRLDRLLARLAADDYSGAVSIELSPDALSAGRSDAEVVGLLAGSLEYCRRSAQGN
jgi:sugar phosphate isomerase/epimerase